MIFLRINYTSYRMSRSLPDTSVIVSLIPRLLQMSTHPQSLGDEATHSFEKQKQFTLELRKTDYPNWLVREYRHEYPCCHCSTMLCVSYRVDVRRFHIPDIFHVMSGKRMVVSVAFSRKRALAIMCRQYVVQFQLWTIYQTVSTFCWWNCLGSMHWCYLLTENCYHGY